MTIQDKEWLSHQVVRLSLSGLTQEQIARQLHVSEGTVNSVIQESMKSDDSLVLQREIAIVSKSSHISMPQLASNLAFANAIKARAYVNDKLESVLGALDSICIRDGSFNPITIASIIMQFCELVIKNNISLSDIYLQIKSKYLELDKLDRRIDIKKIRIAQLQKKLEIQFAKHELTGPILQRFLSLKEEFEEVGIDFDQREEILNVLYNLDEMNKDPKKIINEIKRIRFLKLHKVSLMKECEKIENILENHKKNRDIVEARMGLYNQAVDIINKILQRGNTHENTIKIFDIYSKHQEISLDQFAYDIDTYGGIQSAIEKKYLDSLRMDSATQDPNGYAADASQSQQVREASP